HLVSEETFVGQARAVRREAQLVERRQLAESGELLRLFPGQRRARRGGSSRRSGEHAQAKEQRRHHRAGGQARSEMSISSHVARSTGFSLPSARMHLYPVCHLPVTGWKLTARSRPR